jgi:hypothetical protein
LCFVKIKTIAGANESMPQIMAVQAVPLGSVVQDVMADGAISSGVTVDGAALGDAKEIEEVEEPREVVETGVEKDADAFTNEVVTSTVRCVSIL